MTCHPLLWSVGRGRRAEDAVFQMGASQAALAFMLEHRIRGQAVMPGACMLEMAAAAGKVIPDPNHMPAALASELSSWGHHSPLHISTVCYPLPMRASWTVYNSTSHTGSLSHVHTLGFHSSWQKR